MFRRLAIVLSVVLCIGVAPGPAAAGDGADEAESSSTSESSETSDEKLSPKEKSIRKLLEITGTPELGLQMAQRILQRMKQTHPDVPEKFWDEFEAEMKKDAFIDLIVPIYDKHFSHEDVKKLIEFYKTDVGQKYVEKLPTLTRESMQAGRRWGQRLGQRVVEQLQKRGYR